MICSYGHLSHFRAGPGPCFRADQYHFPATMFANSRLYTINQFQHFNHQQAGWLLIGIQLQKPLNSHRQQYNPPTEYLFLVQKRKRKLVSRIKKNIAKFDIKPKDIGFNNNLITKY
jgi:hypothetical protein